MRFQAPPATLLASLLGALTTSACAGLPGLGGAAASTGAAKLELAGLEVTELDGNGDDVPNRGETLYLKPIFKNTGSGASGEFTVRLSVAAPGSTHSRGLGSDKLTVASVPAGETSAKQSNFLLGLKLDKAATPGTSLPLTLSATLAGGAAQTFETQVVVAPIANAFALAETAIAEVSGNGDGKPNKGEVLYLKPRFTNTGGAKTNSLTVTLAATGALSVYTGGEAASFISIGVLPAGETSKAPAQSFLGVRISSSATPGAALPLTYTLKDPFGNSWDVAAQLTLAE